MAWPLLPRGYCQALQSSQLNPQIPWYLTMSEIAAARKQRRILVVDGNLHSRDGLRDSLRTTSDGVETAAGGWEAIRKIRAARYDVAVIDLDLPPGRDVGITGWDLVRIFRAYLPSISIIALSAEDERAHEAQAAQLGITNFLEKPISPARLRAIVRALDHPVEACSPTGCPTCA